MFLSWMKRNVVKYSIDADIAWFAIKINEVVSWKEYRIIKLTVNIDRNAVVALGYLQKVLINKDSDELTVSVKGNC